VLAHYVFIGVLQDHIQHPWPSIFWKETFHVKLSFGVFIIVFYALIKAYCHFVIHLFHLLIFNYPQRCFNVFLVLTKLRSFPKQISHQFEFLLRMFFILKETKIEGRNTFYWFKKIIKRGNKMFTHYKERVIRKSKVNCSYPNQVWNDIKRLLHANSY
jgi:hypothetical protein